MPVLETIGSSSARAFGLNAGGGPLAVTYFGSGIDGAVTIAADTQLTVLNKNGAYDGDMVVRQYSSLTINSGVTLTVDQPCRGLFIMVDGNCTINGAISMTARGANANPTVSGGSDASAVNSGGIQFPIVTAASTGTFDFGPNANQFNGCGTAIKDVFKTKIWSVAQTITVPRLGAAGAASGSSSGTGNSGSNGDINAMTGGGGGGGRGDGGASIGAGGRGSCFAGGAGSGGARASSSGAGGDYGGAGSAAAVGCGSCNGGGGAGNPGGAGQQGAANGGAGCGGLLILMVKGDLTIGGSGGLTSAGSAGGNAFLIGSYANEGGGGGGSGAGTVLAYYKGTLSNSGTVSAAGGAGGAHSSANNPGGPGGNGYTSIVRVI
jgi:hypothetical protein